MAEYTYTVTLNEAENKALHIVAVDGQAWIDNVVHERCRWAIEEIYEKEIKRMLEEKDLTNVTADKHTVVIAANIPSAAERTAQIQAGLPSPDPITSTTGLDIAPPAAESIAATQG